MGCLLRKTADYPDYLKRRLDIALSSWRGNGMGGVFLMWNVGTAGRLKEEDKGYLTVRL